MSITAFTLIDGQNRPVIGASVAITAEVGISETITLEARFTPGIVPLAPGAYTAQITARDAQTGQTVSVSWPFEAVAATQRTYLPMARR